MALHYTQEDKVTEVLQLAVEHSVPVFVKWGAKWCQPCKIVEPPFKTLAEQKKDVAYFLSLDIEELPDLAKESKVTSVPTFWTIRNKKIVDKVVGANWAAVLAMINDQLKE